MLAHWKENYDKPRNCTKKQRYHFTDKDPCSQIYGFSVVMYECESWTIKKAEHQRIDAFELWCWRRLLIFPWTTRRSNQSILKEISPEYWLEGLMLKLKLNTLATWCKELTHWKRPWYWERLRARGEGVTRDEMVGWYHWFNGYEFEQTPEDSEGQGRLVCYNSWGCKESDTAQRPNKCRWGAAVLK